MWSQNKLRKLVKHYPYTDNAELARELKMSKAMVIAKAEELGLEKGEIIEREQEASLGEIKPKWTSQQLDLLVEHYPNHSNAYIATGLAKSKLEVEHMAYRLGLKKAEDYYQIVNKPDEEIAVKIWDDMYHKGLAPSRGHYILGQILRMMYPNYRLVGEEPIIGLRIDWLLPQLKLAFEFDGSQHTVYSDYFYANRWDFQRAQERDYAKSHACEAEGIAIVRIDYKEKLSFGLVRAKIDEVL